MSDVKRLIIAIAMVAIGLGVVLSGAKGIVPYIGGLIGLIGSYITIKVILTGHLQ